MPPDVAKRGTRDIPFGAAHSDGIGRSFPGNTIKTSKYTCLTFLPLNLMEQLCKAANAYFLLISLLMLVGRRSGLFATSVDWITTLGPLILMMSASAVLAAADDRRRHQSDARTNRQQARAIRMGGKHGVYLDTVTWADIAVGDILVVKGEEDLPADIIPLACSGTDGTCYVSTANLDGETNLKIKSAAPPSQAALCGEGVPDTTGAPEPPLLNQAVERLASLGGVVEAEAPSKSIHTFNGCLTLGAAKGRHALCATHLLLRGTQLKNTAWCFGVVVYTGQETRMAKNSSRTPMKLANLERVVNRAMLIVLGTQAALALLSDLMYCASKETFWSYWYLFPDASGRTSILLPDWVGYWFTFFILYCNLMPISLYAAMEVCNFAQAYFIKSDLAMYDEVQDCPAMVRSTNLCHELGQVSYIFSDKTGTLTQNVMELKRISVANRVFGEVTEERGFTGTADLAAARKDPGVSRSVDAFLEVLAVSHTVMVTEDQWGTVKYEAESPDEGALVEAARNLGWNFCGRGGQALTVDVGAATGQVYSVLAVNAFTSARKRMSVVVRTPRRELLLLVKGADNVMLERAAFEDPKLQEHLTMFAQEGLRTLVLGSRKIEDEEFEAWHAEYEHAQSAVQDREQLLAVAAEKLEVRLQIVGATGIEDKLQVGVADTIVRLRQAGIKLWVLTGDKLETARNIGYSTRVLSDEMDVLILDIRAEELQDELKEQLAQMEQSCRDAVAAQREAALMVTGASLERVADLGLGKSFLEVATRCKVVIACRVSPLQKAWMVRLVRTGITPQPVTLSIGDGANDVPMIQEAQVGVGVSGREGRQAVNAADFAIAQFQYLQRLLLVHGRLDYRRTCKFILYSFWKNSVLTLLLFYYTFVSGFSGTSMFEGMVWTSFNVILFWPIIATGVFDRDVEDEHALEFPKLYENGRLGLDLNLVKMVEMLLSALVHSLIVFAVMLLAFIRMDTMHANDYYGFGTSVFSWLVVAMNYRVVFVTTTINWIFVGAVMSSFLLYILFLVIYCRSQWLSPWMYNVDLHMVQEPLFWIGLLAVPGLAIMVDSFKAYLLLEFLPDRRGLVLERVSLRSGGQPTPPEAIAAAPLAAESGGEAAARPAVAGPVLRSRREDEVPSFDTVPMSESSASRSGLGSSFIFDHPETEPRRFTFLRHPTAGDTSLVDPPTAQPTASAQADVESGGGGSCSGPSLRRPHESRFSQQALPHIQNVVTARWVMKAALGTGSVLLVLGAVVLAQSEKVAQFEIQYDGKEKRQMGTYPSELHYRPCPLGEGGVGRSCSFTVEVPEDMQPPIAVLYEVSPFYQNYYSYLTSVVFDELAGEEVPESEVAAACVTESTRRTPSQERIFPCGLIATTVFNDTVHIAGVVIDREAREMNWKSNFDRFHNPADYPNSSGFSWLYERYPTVTDQARGVKSRHFVDWMFPSFFGHVTNPYGFISTPFHAGQELTVHIDVNFPVESLGAEKRIILTTRNGLGGRHAVLAYLLLASGLACYAMAAVASAIQARCPRRAGRPRFGTSPSMEVEDRAAAAASQAAAAEAGPSAGAPAGAPAGANGAPSL